MPIPGFVMTALMVSAAALGATPGQGRPVGPDRPVQPSGARAEVDAALSAYNDLIVRMDADRIAASFTADGQSADGDQPPLKGPAAIRAKLAGFTGFRVIANRLTADSTRVVADTAWQSGTYWQRVRLPAGDTVEVRGRIDVTWFRTGAGHWQIRRLHTFRNG